MKNLIIILAVALLATACAKKDDNLNLALQKHDQLRGYENGKN